MASRFLCAGVLALLMAAASVAIANDIGAVVKVLPGATVTRAGQVSDLLAGQGVASGDRIETDKGGQVQLLFDDETRMAIGPSSSLVIDDVRMRKNGTARKFAVSAVAGGFRFLSGKSPKPVYSLTTPTATMGIRGTAFDFVVRKSAQTDLVLFTGEVRMCSKSGGCRPVTGGCAAVKMDANGAINDVSKHSEKRDLIFDGFSFVTEQRKLLPEFRTDLGLCGRDITAALMPDVRNEPRKTAPGPKPPPDDPPPDPPDDPPPDDPPTDPPGGN